MQFNRYQTRFFVFVFYNYSKKRINIELNVYQIGDQKTLSKEDKLRIREFIKFNRQKRINRRKTRSKVTIF